MLIEPLQSLKVRLPKGIQTLEPGHTYDLSDKQAQKLLAKAPGRVKRVLPEVGAVVWYRYANYGPFTDCLVLEIKESSGWPYVLVRHLDNRESWVDSEFIRWGELHE